MQKFEYYLISLEFHMFLDMCLVCLKSAVRHVRVYLDTTKTPLRQEIVILQVVAF